MGTDNDPIREPSAEARRAGYETSGISVKGLAIFLVCLVVIAAAIHVAIWYLLEGMMSMAERKDVPQSALTDASYAARFNREHGTSVQPIASPPPPAPRIQPNEADDRTTLGESVPQAELQFMYEKEDALFTQMGWTIERPTHVQRTIPPEVIDAVTRAEGQSGASTRTAGNAGGLGPEGTAPEPH